VQLTLCNAAGRDAQVAAESVKIPIRIRRLDRDGRQCQSVRFLKGTLDRSYAALLRRAPGAGATRLAEALIAGDPEIDFEQVGRFLRPGESQRVWINPAGQVVHAITRQEIVRNPDGTEKLRRPAAIADANLHLPLGWSGKLIGKAEAVKKFVLAGKRQIRHVNGLTYDFLYAIARELEEKNAVLLVGAGAKGNQPLILRRGALPYRGFLEGRTRADQYCLVLHLSNMELRSPEPTDV
jgi:hypothetical protein